MKSFIKKLAFFFAILVLLIIVGLLLPPTPRASTSHMFAKIKMDSLLRTVDSPRLILVGGSNISLSINSQMLRDSLHVNPINTGISWGIGFLYMFENTLEYIQPGDIVVASLEYNQFYEGNVFGDEDLARTVLDVSRDDLFNLRPRQYFKILPEIPYYALSKFALNEYVFERDPMEIYDRNATNQYGDNCKHWKQRSKKVRPIGKTKKESDEYAFDILQSLNAAIREKGARLIITFPALQRASYMNIQPRIREIEEQYRRRNFTVVGTPERYVMPDSLLFDTPYHLIKRGVDLRTNLLIQDLKTVMITTKSQ